MSDDERKYWLDERKNVNKIIYGLCTICAVVAMIDLFPYKHHLHFRFEYFPGFFSLYGFIACVSLVLAAKQLRKIVMRDEDYYD
jgi:uncharacterized membrane protein